MFIVPKSVGYILAGLSVLGTSNEALCRQELTKDLEPTPLVKPIDFDLSKFSFELSNLDIKRQLPELSSKELAYYKNIIESEFSEIQFFEREVLLDKNIQHLIRLEINKLTSVGTTFNQKLSELLYSDLYKIIPDILELVKIVNKDELDFIETSWVYYNPRVIEYLWQKGIQPSKEENKALLRMQNALELLGIFELRRFDNVSEIIKNRYLISDLETQLKLKELLPKNYFNNISTEQINTDQRPIYLVLYPAQKADHNGAFHETGDLYTQIMSDDIDYLTSQYRVIYFECETSSAVIDAIKNTSIRTNETINYLLLGGHGNSLGIEFSNNAIKGELSIDDFDELQKISSYISNNAMVILKSCSTAKTDKNGKSFASVLHQAWPHTEIIAPNNDTPAMLKFDEAGNILGINYSLASAVKFKPNGQVEYENLTDNIYKIVSENSLNLANKSIRDIKSLSLINIGQLAIGFFLAKWAFDGIKFLGKRLNYFFRRKQTPNLKLYVPNDGAPTSGWPRYRPRHS